MKSARTTFRQDFFNNLHVPTLNSFNVSGLLFPIDIEFNRTYYKLCDTKITAFRVLAISFAYDKIASYLIQLPNTPPMWIKRFIGKESVIFDKSEDYFDYMQGKTNLNLNLSWLWTYASAITKRYGLTTNSCTEINHSWFWDDKTQQPKNKPTLVTHFLILENEVILGLSHDKDCFQTKEACIENHIKDFVIEDFEDEVSEVTITILPSKAKVRTIQIIEV